MLVVAVLASAQGAVQVEDANDCLDRDALEEEVRAVLGDATVDRIELVARLGDVDDRWQLDLFVSEAGAVIWQRALPVQPVDCPYLPALVARSVERGLSEIPGWSFDATPKRARPELLLSFTATAPPALLEAPDPAAAERPARAPHWAIGPLVSLPVRGFVRWEIEGFAFWSSFERVGDGGLQVVGGAAGTGPALLVPVGGSALRAAVRGSLGPQFSIGQGFRVNDLDLLPYTRTTAEVGFAWQRVIHVLLRAEYVNLNFAWCPAARNACAPDDPRTVDPRLRLGLVFAIGGPVGSGDVGPRDRS